MILDTFFLANMVYMEEGYPLITNNLAQNPKELENHL